MLIHWDILLSFLPLYTWALWARVARDQIKILFDKVAKRVFWGTSGQRHDMGAVDAAMQGRGRKEGTNSPKNVGQFCKVDYTTSKIMDFRCSKTPIHRIIWGTQKSEVNWVNCKLGFQWSGHYQYWKWVASLKSLNICGLDRNIRNDFHHRIKSIFTRSVS